MTTLIFHLAGAVLSEQNTIKEFVLKKIKRQYNCSFSELDRSLARLLLRQSLYLFTDSERVERPLLEALLGAGG